VLLSMNKLECFWLKIVLAQSNIKQIMVEIIGLLLG
jgi:hypothetical protein